MNLNTETNRMQVIFNIAMLREKITGSKMDLDNLQKYDVYTMDYDQLHHLQNSLLRAYNKKVSSIVTSINIHGKLWFQKSYGNTYHSVNVIVFSRDGDGNTSTKIYKSPITYGYEDAFIDTALSLLDKETNLLEGNVNLQQLKSNGI